MAKKSSDTTGSPAPKRATSTRRPRGSSGPAAAPVDIASVSPTEPIHMAEDRDSGNGSARPSPDEIAQAAYERYLSRGGTHGRDFDDWIEAERELAGRHTR